MKILLDLVLGISLLPDSLWGILDCHGSSNSDKSDLLHILLHKGADSSPTTGLLSFKVPFLVC